MRRAHALPDDELRQRGRRAGMAMPRWLVPLVGLALLTAVAWLIADRARKIDWADVWQMLRGYPPATLAAALALAFATHACYASYDLLARRHLRHHAPTFTVLGIGMVSFAVNLNLGWLVGGIGLRWRLYSKLGLSAGQIGRIFTFGIFTNWLGYLCVAGTLLATRAFGLPPPLDVSPALQQLLGVALLAVPASYVAWCARARLRTVRWRSHGFELPATWVAVTQLALASAQWMLMGSVAWTLMPSQLHYATVLGTLLSASVVGATVHVPGGLGVIEAVFVTALAGRAPEGALVASVLAYRAVFYLLPLAGAIAMHFALERQTRRGSVGTVGEKASSES